MARTGRVLSPSSVTVARATGLPVGRSVTVPWRPCARAGVATSSMHSDSFSVYALKGGVRSTSPIVVSPISTPTRSGRKQGATGEGCYIAEDHAARRNDDSAPDVSQLPRAVASVSEQPYVPAAGRDWLLPLYDPFTRLLGAERFHRRLLGQAAITPGARVLEIGCGTGNLAILARRLYPQAEVVGIDPDPKALARARRKAGRGGLQVQFDRAYAERLPFPEASFDVVLSALMLHHLPSDLRVAALREARRVLTPAGSLHLVDFAGAADTGGLHAFLGRLVHGHHGARSRDQDALPDAMRAAGFASATEIGEHSGILGRIVYYHATGLAAAPPVGA